MRLKIITTDREVLSWRSLGVKLKAIEEALNKTQNATWTVSIEYRDITPEVIGGRITHQWFDTFAYPLFRQGFHHVYLHFSMKRWEELGLDQGIRGANQVDSDFVGECYGRGDEHTLRGYSHKNQFIQNILHEMSHELARSTGVADHTHAYHAVKPDISGIFTSYDMAKWQPIYQEGQRVRISLMQKIIELLKRPEEDLFHPVQWKPRIISQAYGISSKRYPRTGRHIGTDYAIPLGTPLHAPALGQVIEAGTGKNTGHYCLFQYTFKGKVIVERWCHLLQVPRLGSYGRAAVVARSGNTGDSDGPHLHRECWKGSFLLGLINHQNWDELTLDPEALI